MNSIITQIPDHKIHVSGKKTLEIGYPWLALGAIIALEHLINRHFNVLEFGSGGSTVFWATRVKKVKSYETDPGWIELVKKRTEGFANVEIILTTRDQFIKEIAKEPDSHYDLVLIDSNPRQINRLLIANSVVPKLKKNGFMVIDNYFAFKMENFTYDSWEVYTFDEPGFKGKGTRICRKI